VNAARKLAMLDAIQQFGGTDGLSANSMRALVGEGHRDQKNVIFMFDKFSWTARKLLQLALLVNRQGHKSPQGSIAMLEILKGMDQLCPAELLAVSTAMDHGMEGLREVKPNVELLKGK
jgi:hypothetical protein